MKICFSHPHTIPEGFSVPPTSGSKKYIDGFQEIGLPCAVLTVNMKLTLLVDLKGKVFEIPEVL